MGTRAPDLQQDWAGPGACKAAGKGSLEGVIGPACFFGLVLGLAFVRGPDRSLFIKTRPSRRTLREQSSVAKVQASAEENPERTILRRFPQCLPEKFVVLQAGERPEVFKGRIVYCSCSCLGFRLFT